MAPEKSAVATCLNCGAPVADKYCGHCGQRSGDVRLSLRDLLHELAAEHFGLDTKVARTLVTLVRKPGQLTTEFLAGRRMSYVPPLRLYLSLSVLFFLLSALKSDTATSPDRSDGVRAVQLGKADSSAAAASSAIARAAADSVVPSRIADKSIADTLHGNAVSLFFKRRFVQRIAYLKAHRQEATQHISESFHHELPDALFLLVPGLALALSALYRRSGRFYVEHLVFALHFQAFSFAALTVGLLPVPVLGTVIGLAILAYLFLAMRRVYGGTMLATTGKLTVVVVGYGVALALIMGIVGMIAFMFS
ncbi:MAG: DUF3667 domain-containing protein [Gemmatimonadota bacterium]|nr:DUF3667 domain-containing protein [Gemmatimonadota bacterium]